MAFYEWGKGSPAQQERRVTEAEKRLAEQEAEIEAAYREAKAGLENRRRDVVEMRAQLDRYYHKISQKKARVAIDAEERQPKIPTRLDFILKSIRAEMAIVDAEQAVFEDSVGEELKAVIAEISPDEAVDAVLARVDIGDDVRIVAREAVVADLVFCEQAMASAQEQGGYAVIRALTQIEKHFEIFDTSDPVYGLPEARWREIVAAWAVEFNIPDTVIRPFDAGGFRGAKAGLALSSFRIQEIHIDEKTGFAISATGVLDERLREAAGIDLSVKIDGSIDPLDGFLKPARAALKRAMGTEAELSQRRLLDGMEEVAPFVLIPGAAHAAKRARDQYSGLLIGERQKVEFPWAEADRKVFGILLHLSDHFTFGNVNFDEEGMSRLRAFAASLVAGEVAE